MVKFEGADEPPTLPGDDPQQAANELEVFAEQHGVALDSGSDVAGFIQEDTAHLHDPAERMADMSTGQVLAYEPMNPVEISFAIESIQAALVRYGMVYPLLVAKRYAAESAYIRAKATARLNAPAGLYSSDRAAYADLHSMDELEAFQAAKEQQYAADALEKALRSRLFGYLNLNRTTAALFNSEPR